MKKVLAAWAGAGIAAGLALLLVHAPIALAANSVDEGRVVAVEGGGQYVDIDVPVLARMLARKDFALINVHVPYEGEIRGTDVFIPFDQVSAHADRLPADPSAKIVLYCMSGRMSTLAAHELVQRGYANVWHLAGGMIAWTEAGLPLVDTRAGTLKTVEGTVADTNVIVCDRRPGRCEGSLVLEPKDTWSVPVAIRVGKGTQIMEGGRHLVLPAINRRSVAITYVEEEDEKVATSIDVKPAP